jgi:thiosulfate/3-mercaptopyruvate sulfurtransferase
MASPIITVRELRDLPTTPVLLDVRYRMGGPPGHPEYLAGHIPGAAYVDLDADLADPPGSGGRHPLPEVGRFQAAMRRAGVRDDRPVVVYDDWSGHAAARCWWLLRHHGHADARVLDGGWAAWRSEDGPVATGEDPPVAGDFTADPGHMPVVDADGVLGLARTGVLIDARAPERYRGEVEPVDRVAGHIPGAVNVPTARNLDQDGRFRSEAELRDVYSAVGVPVGARDTGAAAAVAAYCGSGVTAALDVLALASVGVEAALYPGSWSGWITDPSHPVER